MTGARIVSLGVCTPDRAVGNDEIARPLGLDGSWIEERTGIRSRRLAGSAETTATLGATAARRALNGAGLSADEVDLIICASVTPDLRFPATACLIQHAIGGAAAAFDLNAGCAGFLVGLAQADALVRAGSAEYVLVVGAETLSRITDHGDPKTAVLFGDGAGAALVGRSENDSIGAFTLFSDGSRPELLHVNPNTDKIHMEGREVYRAAVAGMASSVAEVLETSSVALDEVDLVIAHQANLRILTAVAERLGLPAEKMFTNIERYGNTSAASIPIALAEAQESGRLHNGDLVVLAAFGAGFVWGAGLVRWAAGIDAARAVVESVGAHA